MIKFYAGIGSRRAPVGILELMTQFASKIEQEGYVLRSGGADGADKAFAQGTSSSEIFKSSDAQDWAYDVAESCLPTDRSNFRSWKPYVQGLIARNMMQVLGKNSDQPVEFVLCWTPSTFYEDSSAGGTGYAIRCALKNNIPVINLVEEDSLLLITQYVQSPDNIEEFLNADR